jgi:hypothetical protein
MQTKFNTTIAPLALARPCGNHYEKTATRKDAIR